MHSLIHMNFIYLFTSCITSSVKKQSATPTSIRFLQCSDLYNYLTMPITPITVLSNICNGSMFSTSHTSVIFLIYFPIYI